MKPRDKAIAKVVGSAGSQAVILRACEQNSNDMNHLKRCMREAANALEDAYNEYADVMGYRLGGWVKVK